MIFLMCIEQTIDKVLTLASQQYEAGFAGWSRIKSILQFTITSPLGTKHWCFDPTSSVGFSKIDAPSTRHPLAELSEETFVHFLRGERNLQQAYLDSQITLYGSLPETLFFTCLFDQLAQVALRDCRENDSSRLPKG